MIKLQKERKGQIWHIYWHYVTVQPETLTWEDASIAVSQVNLSS